VHTSFFNGILPTLYGRVDREFSLLLFPLIALWALVPVIRRRWPNQTATTAGRTANPIVLLLAALPFLCVFPELWVAQYYPFLMVVPFYAVGFATLIAVLLESGNTAVRGIALAVVAALSLNIADELVHFKKAYFDRASIVTLRTQLDSLAPRGRWVLANNLLEGQYRFFFDRNIVPLIVHPFPVMPSVMQYFSDPQHPQFAGPEGALFVQHKHLTDEIFDKHYYYVLARNQLWKAWGNPPRYRVLVDGVVAGRDSAMTAVAARVGEKLYENDFYILWRIHPFAFAGAPAGASPTTRVK
jgi:hypothetical protein